jgi:hypothetical protein
MATKFVIHRELRATTPAPVRPPNPDGWSAMSPQRAVVLLLVAVAIAALGTLLWIGWSLRYYV